MKNQIKNFFSHNTAIIEEGAQIGNNTKIWCFSHVMKEAQIGSDCNIGQNVFVDNGAVIGNNCKVQNNCNIYEGVTLEDYVFCGPSMTFTNDLSPRCKFPKTREQRIKTLVREGATIGANCTIICGNTIGKYAMIAAGAVITSDVLEFALMMGVPAKRKGWVCECGKVLKEDLRCNACSKEYIEIDNRLKKV